MAAHAARCFCVMQRAGSPSLSCSTTNTRQSLIFKPLLTLDCTLSFNHSQIPPAIICLCTAKSFWRTAHVSISR